jgi:beta-glucosidase
VNGRWAASNYDLTVRLLRNDFGFDGFVMTDWWAKVSAEDGSACDTNLAAMVHAMNDIYMVTPDATTRDDNLPTALADGRLSRGELQKCAVNLINFAIDSLSYMAQKEGYGKRDLKEACAGATPLYTASVEDNHAKIYSGTAQKVILRVTFASETPALVQTNIGLNVNTKNVDAFIVGGTEGSTVSDYREISLVAGDNEFIFASDDPLAKAVSIEIFR